MKCRVCGRLINDWEIVCGNCMKHEADKIRKQEKWESETNEW